MLTKFHEKHFFQITIFLALVSVALAEPKADLVRRGRQGGRNLSQRQRQSRQDAAIIQGGVDFSGCVNDRESGLCCVEKEETVTSIEKV